MFENYKGLTVLVLLFNNAKACVSKNYERPKNFEEQE